MNSLHLPSFGLCLWLLLLSVMIASLFGLAQGADRREVIVGTSILFVGLLAFDFFIGNRQLLWNMIVFLYPIVCFAISYRLVSWALRPTTNRLPALLAIYFAVGTSFGVCYYKIYRSFPGQFVFCEEIRKASEIKALIETQNAVSAAITNVHIADAFIIAWPEWAKKKETISTNSGQEKKTVIDENLTFWTTTAERVVYEIDNTKMTEDVNFIHLELKTERGNDVALVELAIGVDSIKIDEVLASLVEFRRLQVNALHSLFLKEGAQIVPFTQWDFFYFSFTVRGASDIIPATTQMRFGILLQVLVIVVLAGWKEERIANTVHTSLRNTLDRKV